LKNKKSGAVNMNVRDLIDELVAIQAVHRDLEVFVYQDGDCRYSAVNCVDVDERDEDPSVSIHID